RLGQIGAQPDDPHRRIMFEDLGECFAQEAHFGDDGDAQTPSIGGKRGRLVRSDVCIHSNSPIVSRQDPSPGWQDWRTDQPDETGGHRSQPLLNAVQLLGILTSFRNSLFWARTASHFAAAATVSVRSDSFSCKAVRRVYLPAQKSTAG